MASEGPKSDAARPAAKPVGKSPAKVAVKPADGKPVPATPPVAAAEPVPVPVPVPKPAPVAAKPASVVAAPAPLAAKAVSDAKTAPVAAPTPVMTPEPLAPVPALAATSSKKDTIMEATLKTASDKTQAMFADATTRAKSAMEKGSKMLEDMNDFSKGNVEAMVESSKIAANGAEEVAKYTTDYAKATVEKATAAAKQFASVKSPTELFKLQSEMAKDAMDSMMAETAKFTESYLKLLGEIAQPLSNRVALAAEKIKIAA